MTYVKVFIRATRTRFPVLLPRRPSAGADRRQTRPLQAVITGSRGGAAPGSSWHTDHLVTPLLLICFSG